MTAPTGCARSGAAAAPQPWPPGEGAAAALAALRGGLGAHRGRRTRRGSETARPPPSGSVCQKPCENSQRGASSAGTHNPDLAIANAQGYRAEERGWKRSDSFGIAQQTGQMLMNLLENTIPVSELWLAQQGHRPIPRGIAATAHPAEIRIVLEHGPNRNIQCTSKMSNCRIYTDNQV